MNPMTIPAQIPHNLHYSSAKPDSSPRSPARYANVVTGVRLVGAVGVEPTTNGLKGRCSATELRPYFFVTACGFRGRRL